MRHNDNRTFANDVEVLGEFRAPGVPLATTGDITVSVDPDDASPAPAPPAGTIFQNQAQVDAYLASQSATVFEYIQDFLDTLPSIVRHAITLNLADTVHRPRLADTTSLISFDRILENGSLTFEGTAPSTWTQVHAGGTIQAHQVYNEVTGTPDPYVDLPVATFPNDGSLRGMFAVFDNGYVSPIWDHDDTRLWLNAGLSPAPIDSSTTVTVRKPSSLLRNSRDDATKHSASVFRVLSPRTSFNNKEISLQNITSEDYSASIPFFFRNGFSNFEAFLLDKGGSSPLTENGYGIRIWPNAGVKARATCNRFVFLAGLTSGADAALQAIDDTEITSLFSYIQGASRGCTASGYNAKFTIIGSVFRACGGSSVSDAALFTADGGVISSTESTYSEGVRTLIIATRGGYPALSFRENIIDNFYLQAYYGIAIRFRDNTGPCIQLLARAAVNVRDTALSFADDGGNLGVGIKVIGPGATLYLDDGIDVAGALGEIEIEGIIGNYADLPAWPNTLVTLRGNDVSKGVV